MSFLEFSNLGNKLDGPIEDNHLTINYIDNLKKRKEFKFDDHIFYVSIKSITPKQFIKIAIFYFNLHKILKISRAFKFLCVDIDYDFFDKCFKINKKIQIFFGTFKTLILEKINNPIDLKKFKNLTRLIVIPENLITNTKINTDSYFWLKTFGKDSYTPYTETKEDQKLLNSVIIDIYLETYNIFKTVFSFNKFYDMLNTIVSNKNIDIVQILFRKPKLINFAAKKDFFKLRKLKKSYEINVNINSQLLNKILVSKFILINKLKPDMYKPVITEELKKEFILKPYMLYGNEWIYQDDYSFKRELKTWIGEFIDLPQEEEEEEEEGEEEKIDYALFKNINDINDDIKRLKNEQDEYEKENFAVLEKIKTEMNIYKMILDEHKIDYKQLNSSLIFKEYKKVTKMRNIKYLKKEYLKIKKKHNLNTGDLLLFNGSAFISKFIKTITGDQWSHAAICFIIGNKVYTLESTMQDDRDGYPLLKDYYTKIPKNGVQLVEFEKRFIYYQGDIGIRKLYPDLSKSLKDKLINFYFKENKKPFEKNIWELLRAGFDGLWDYVLGKNKENTKQYFCSELIAKIYMHLGLIDNKIPSNEYTPGDFINIGKVEFNFKKKSGYKLGPLITIKKYVSYN